MGAQTQDTEKQYGKSSAARGATYLITIQVVSRVLTFLSNQFLLRQLSPSILGLATQLELYSASTLYFARESIRVALQQQSGDAGKDKDGKGRYQPHAPADHLTGPSREVQAAVNISYFTIIIGSSLAYLLGQAYIRVRLVDTPEDDFFRESFMLVGASTVVELLSEPCFAAIQQSMLLRKRAAIEMISAFVKSSLCCGAAMWMSSRDIAPGVLPFAVGQFGYAAALLCGYLISAISLSNSLGFSLIMRPLCWGENATSTIWSRFIPLRLLQRSTNVYFQSVAKHFLTQGDSILLAAFASLEEQGQYALASNYGGLVARVVFQPIEESSRNVLGKLLDTNREKASTPQQLAAAKSYICQVLHAYAVLSVLIAAIGPALIPVALRLVMGSRWDSSEMQEVLSAYCFYVPLLAFNGVTEAFVSSAANGRELRQQTAWMGIFSAVFAFAVYFLLGVCGLGALGLVLANAMNMGLRIAWSYRFMKQYFSNHCLSFAVTEALPSFGTSVAGVISYTSTMAIRRTMGSDLYDNFKVFATAVAFGMSILYLERSFIKQQIANFR